LNTMKKSTGRNLKERDGAVFADKNEASLRKERHREGLAVTIGYRHRKTAKF